VIKKILLNAGLVFVLAGAIAQSRASYNSAFDAIQKMLKGKSFLDFKKAVFLSENAFYENKLEYKGFCQKIDSIEIQLNQFMQDKAVTNHVMGKHFAIFNYMMEPSKYNVQEKLKYDFEDLMGNKDWSKMFVTKLLKTKTGNCHSLPYLYKILSEELGAEAYLALGPNHIYAKHKDDKGQWVNIELTNGTFPRDGWIISSLSITTDAIKSGTYMEPLTLKESVTLALLDLALGYKFQFGSDDFILRCTDEVIANFPKCINAYMIKREALMEKRMFILKAKGTQMSKEISRLEKMISDLDNKIGMMGYKEMPKEQYAQWVKDAENERKKQAKANTLENPKTNKK
jgi:hypothetical protein